MKNNCLVYLTALFIFISIFTATSILAQNGNPEEINEVQYLLEKFSKCYIDTLRGNTPQEWNEKKNVLLRKVKEAKNGYEYWYALRYFGALINDYHSQFPDGGLYNRTGIFSKTDTIFPIWVKTWEDGRVFVVKDYTNTIPVNSEIISVNKYSAKELAVTLRQICFGEYRYSNSYSNDQEEGDVRVWTNFPNMLFCEKIYAPFEIEYIPYKESNSNQVVVQGLERGKIYAEYKKTGDKKKVKAKRGYAQKPVSYERYNDSIAVLKINVFYGKNPLNLLFSSNDSRYNRLLKKSMKNIAKDGITHLVVDIRGNPGGYMGSVSRTLDYFTDKDYGDKDVYLVSAESKKRAPSVLKNTYKITYGNTHKEEIQKSLDIFQEMPEGSIFRTDTILPMLHTPAKLPFKYHGNIYVLTDALCYSGSIIFCNLIRELNRGLLVGTSPGGYSNVTGGPRISIDLPYSTFIPMNISYSLNRVKDSNEYIEMDYDIKQTFNEWLNNEDTSKEKLINDILNRKLISE